ncbi:MAG: hypothetical protein ACOX5W_12360 [Bacillota bacterium]
MPISINILQKEPGVSITGGTVLPAGCCHGEGFSGRDKIGTGRLWDRLSSLRTITRV